MAKVKYSANMALNNEPELGANYFPDPNLVITLPFTDTSAVFVSTTNSFIVDLIGKGFQYDGDELVGGTVTKVRFLDGDGDVLAVISDFKKSASSLMAPLQVEVSDFLAELLKHKDQMIGSSAGEDIIGEAGSDQIDGRGGDDLLSGNTGDDILTGGKGNDSFWFYADSDQDIITDFNVGDDVNFDTLGIRDVGFQMVKFEKQLMLEFSDGGSVLLEGVKFSERNDIHVDAIL